MSEKMTLDQLKQTPTYRWIKELTTIYDAAGVRGEPVEIPIKAVMEAPLPDYLPIIGAIKVKYMFIHTIYFTGGRYGAMQDAMVGIMNMMQIAHTEL
jgi:hypothetical protein